MMAARAKDRPGQHQLRTPPRTKLSRLSPPAPPIHSVTPDRYVSKSHNKHSSSKRQPPIVTPPYNPYNNGRPMYYPSPPHYGHGNVPSPPSFPGPPPPMPSNVAAYYQPHYPQLPPPMPSNSDYHLHYAYSHGNTRYQGYAPQNPNTHAAGGHNGYNNYYPQRERHQPHPPQAYASGPKQPLCPWNYDSAASAGYKPMKRNQPFKTEEQPQADHPKSAPEDDRDSEFKIPIRKKSSTDNDDMSKIQAMMSFDSIKSHQMRFTLSFEEGGQKQPEGLDDSNQGCFGGLQDGEESILGLLRDDLVPFDTSNGISFQLSWDRSVN